MMYRSFLGFVVVVVIASAFGTLGQIKTTRLGLHTLRNLCHFAGQNLWFFALPLIPLAQLFALEFTSPIWVILLAPIFLGERLTRRKIAIAVLGFVGVLLVARPDMTALNIGILAGALAAVGFAGAAMATRELTKTDSITCVLFYLTTMQAVFGIITAIWTGPITAPSFLTAPWLILIGIAGLTAHFCITKALSLAPASVVMPVDFIRLPLIALIGYLFYAEQLDLWTVLGATIIITANYLNITQKT